MAVELLQAAGAASSDAQFIADVHLAKALHGDPERGLPLLLAEIDGARAGTIDLAPTIRLLRDHGATALVDCSARACGKLVCRDAMTLAITKARAYGVGWVSARARGEILTPFIEQAVGAGMVAMVMAQSIPTVAPHGGSSPMLGNAPLAWGIPAGTNAPVIVDMSLTQSSAKGVVRAAREGEPLPPGLLLDSAGEPSTDAQAFLDPVWLALGKQVARGSLVPIGGSHKSYAQIFVAGLLSSLLADTDFSWSLGNEVPGPRRFGTLFLALDPEAFGDKGRLLARVDEYIDYLRAAPRKAGVTEILYPGERSQAVKRASEEDDRLTLPAELYQRLVVSSRGLHA